MKMRWSDEWLDLRGLPVVYVEDPDDPGNYIPSKIFVGEEDPAIGGDVPYVWMKPSDLATPTKQLIDLDFVNRSGTDITLNNITTWAEIAAATNGPGTGGFDLTLTGVVTGDVVEVTMSALLGNTTPEIALDYVTVVGGSVTNSVSNGTGTPHSDGIRGWYMDDSTYRNPGSPFFYTLQSGDISSSTVILRPRYKSSAANNRTMYTSSGGLQFAARAWRIS